MFAVIRTGGKQHRVSENDRITVERLAGAPGDRIALGDILMLAEDGAAPLVGTQVPSEARVFADVVEQMRGPKVLVFKKKRRKNHRRLNGHRQDLTVLRIAAISATGAVAAVAAEPVAVPETPDPSIAEE
jgi:large subunit ribosomal protein L21